MKQKAVGLEGPLMLDNGKSPGKSFSDFALKGKFESCHLDVAVTMSVVHTCQRGRGGSVCPVHNFPAVWEWWMNVGGYGGTLLPFSGVLKGAIKRYIEHGSASTDV